MNKFLVAFFMSNNIRILYHVKVLMPTPGRHLNPLPTNIMPAVNIIDFRRPTKK